MSGKSARGDHRLHARQRLRLRVSIDTMRACACGQRRILPHSMPGMRECRRRTPRGRSPCRRRPGGSAACRRLSGLSCRRSSSRAGSSSHFRGGVHHRADDFVVAGATAQIAGQPVAGLGFGRIRDWRRAAPCEATIRPGRAEAALQRRVLEEFLLHRMQLARPAAMPSMVVIAVPSASAPSIRQEQTRRPSTMTLQAPQSPERAAFLAAGQAERRRAARPAGSAAARTGIRPARR